MKESLYQIFLGYQYDAEPERIHLSTVWKAYEHLEDRRGVNEDPYSATYTVIVF